MNFPKFEKILLYILIITLAVPAMAVQNDKDGSKRLLEEVEVSNVVITVRAYRDGKPVDGLKAEDFTVTEDGKEKKITTFFKEKKKLDMSRSTDTVTADASAARRTFVLIFNISDEHLDLKNSVDQFFDKVLRPNDRLIVKTNRFYIKDHVVLDVVREKERIKDIIRLENKWVRMLNTEMIQILANYIGEFEMLLETEGIELKFLLGNFSKKYRNYVRQFRQSFVQIDVPDYLELADYLKRQPGEKWILNFYQIVRFPDILPHSWFEEVLHEHGFLLELKTELYITQNRLSKNIGGLFANSGATCHTLLLKDYRDIKENTLLKYFKYAPITLDSEEILRTISKMTGGKVMRSNNAGRFYQNVSTRQDISYVMAFRSRHTPGEKKPKLEVKVNRPGVRVSFDNQKRKNHYLWQEKKFLNAKKKANPIIRIDRLGYADRKLRIPVANYKVGDEAGLEKGKIRLRLQVMDKKSRVIMDRFVTTETRKNRLQYDIDVNTLSTGQYDVVVLVTDVLTGKEDLAIHEIKI